MAAPENPSNTTSRLLDLQQAAEYLGVSPWTVRDLEASGVIPRVAIPLPNGRELRKLLFDRADLDRLIESWKLPPLDPRDLVPLFSGPCPRRVEPRPRGSARAGRDEHHRTQDAQRVRSVSHRQPWGPPGGGPAVGWTEFWA